MSPRPVLNCFDLKTFQIFRNWADSGGRDDALLQQYGLKANDAILSEEKHMTLYEELIQNRSAKLLAGGAAQNTARGAQVCLPISHRKHTCQ